MAQPGRKKKKFKKGPIIAIVIIGTVLGGGYLLLKKAAENAAGAISIPQELVVEAGSIDRTVNGSGTLQPEETYDIKIPAGITVLETDYMAGDTISEGDIIATLDVESITSCIVTVDQELNTIKDALKDTHDMTEYQIEEYQTRQTMLENQRERLLELYADPYVRADRSGIIMSISAVSAPTSASSYSDVVSSLLGTTIISPFKGADEPSGEEGQEPSDTEPSESGETEPTDTAPTSDTEPSATDSSDTEPSSTEPSSTETTPAPAQPAVITDFSFLHLDAPVRDAAVIRDIDENNFCEGSISWGVGTEEFTGETFAASTGYTALVMLTPKEGYVFSDDHLPQIQGATFSQGIVDPASKVLTLIVMFPATEADPNAAPSSATPAIPGLNPDGSPDLASMLEGVDIQQYIQQYIAAQTAQATSGLDMSSLLGTSGADYSSFASGLASASSRPSSGTPDVTVATIALTDNVQISILVDELDILMVHEGQEADIEIDAVEETFTGTISRVSNLANDAAASGVFGTSNARYQIDISIPMAADMRLGMSATATITVASVEDVPVIPMTALQQRGQDLYVYGGYDEMGMLTDEIPVTTGISDGVNVEITSGISVGDTIYAEDYGSGDALSELLG